jgi:alanyl-tRNA synthetase
LIREAAAAVGGKGGGRPDFAQAGGGDPSKIDEAFAVVRARVQGNS